MRIMWTKTLYFFLIPCFVIRHIRTHTCCHTVSQIDKQGQHNVKAVPITCSFTFAHTHTCTLGRHLSGHLSVRWLSAPWQPSEHLHSNGELKCLVPTHAAHLYGTIQNQSACVGSFLSLVFSLTHDTDVISGWLCVLISIRNTAWDFMNIRPF